MLKNLIIIGASGFGREVAWLVERINKVCPTWNLIGFLDDADDLQGKRIMKTRWQISYDEMVYVGDNPSKDFQAPQHLGMKCLYFCNPDGLYSGTLCGHQMITSLTEIGYLINQA